MPISLRSSPQLGQARSGGAQLVDVCGAREVLKVRQGAPASAPLHPPQFVDRLVRRHVDGSLWFQRQCLAEGEQRLPQLLPRFQPVRPRPVAPLLVALQLQLQTQILKVESVGTLGLARGERSLRYRALLGVIALGPRRPQQRFQRGGVIGQVRGFRGGHTSSDIVIVIWLLTL